jgi:hypothetical protein
MRLRKKDLLGHGCECMCYALSRRRVLKVYEEKADRDYAWEHQKRAYRAGIGPRTLGRLTVGRRFAYISARAKVGDGWPSKRLLSLAQQHGFKTGDLDARPDNVGTWKGRPVIVDFGVITLGVPG